MKKILFAMCHVLCTIAIAYSQGDTLIGAVDGQLIKICHSNADIISYQTVASLPVGCNVTKLGWSASNNCFYTLHTPGAVTNQVATIDENGNYTIKGTVTIGGGTVYHLESIAYDSRSGKLYAAASLNGTVTTSDYWSETLITIDTATLVASIVGVFSHPGVVYFAEADNLALGDDGFFYYSDSEGGGAPFMRIFKQDLGMTSPPVLVYEDLAGGNVGDIAVKDGYLYFVVNRVLRKIDLSDNTHSVVGTMFTSAEFSGKQMGGMDWHHTNFAEVTEISHENLLIYPNPSSGIYRVELAQQDEMKSVKVYSIDGQLILNNEGNTSLTTINLEAYPDGNYLVIVDLKNGITISTELVKLSK